MKAYSAGKQSKEFYPEAMKERREQPRYGFYERATAVQPGTTAVQAHDACRPINRADYFRLFD